MLKAALAIGTAAAIGEGHDRDPVTLRDARHTRARGDDVSREFVPEDLRVLRTGERVRLDGGHDRAGDELVQVRAADPTGGRPDEDLPRSRRRRLLNILDPEVARRVEAESLHPSTSSWDDPLGPQPREEVEEG